VITRPRRSFLLTGATGFLGKVMLEELVRRREELGVDRIAVVIRPLRGRSAVERFRREVVVSRCFQNLPAGWSDRVTVIEANLETPDLAARLRADDTLGHVTHIVHAAASVKFHLPVALAARANIAATLEMLELARSLPAIERFVYVSTAYVAPNTGGPIEEVPVALPEAAESLFAACLGSDEDEATRLLARTGHPNSYTLTKAIAERLLLERHGDVPVTVVRPSVITASRTYPFPAWIDSPAGFTAFVLMTGLGHLRALVCDPTARLDLVPVDEVSQRAIGAAVDDRDAFAIRHAVVGAQRSATIAQCWDETQAFFTAHRVDRLPRGRTLGPRDLRFLAADTLRHRVPLWLSGFGSKAERRRAQKRSARLTSLNTEFTYFTTRTFDFRSSRPIDPAFDGARFIRTIDLGVYRHLLDQDDRQWTAAGRAHPGHGGDLRWALQRPRGNFWIRTAAWAATKVFRRCIDRLTVDVPSFERGLRAIPRGTSLVLTPSHRSYLDFVLCTYIGFVRPDLLPIPHVAATMEFAHVPLIGRLLRAMHAFYLRRGDGIDPTLAARVEGIVGSGHTLSFFIEGGRSRTGEFLPPKRGLLRCLQSTGRTYALLPIAIRYDRVPEQEAFRRELAGEPKATMRVGGLVRWAYDAWRGRVDLGRIHMACGVPVTLTPADDVYVTADRVIDELRRAMGGPADVSAPGANPPIGPMSPVVEVGAATDPR
jgi:fatty acyl-CoA reductase